MTRRLAVLLLALALAALACNTVAPPRPPLEWDTAADALIIEAYHAGGLAPQNYILNEIPLARVYGDGRIVWVESEGLRRRIYQGTLTEAELRSLLTQFSDAGFFGWEPLYGPVNEVRDAGSLVLAVNLKSGRTQVVEYLEGAPPKFHALLDAVSSGAGVVGVEYTPTTAYLIALPAVGSPQPPSYIWPDAEVGFTLAEAVGGRYVEGQALALAWDIVNTDYLARVESDGRTYQLAVQVPGISRVAPPPP